MTDREKAKKLASDAPSMTKEEEQQINALYPAYIFRCRKSREIWTTCCGRHETVPKQEYDDRMAAVMDAEHQAEEKPVRYGCHIGYMSAMSRQKERVTTPCPFCGRDAWVKELGRTGKRDNLAAYKRVVIFRWYREALWARAYYTSKKYDSVNNLTGGPSWTLSKVYRFKPGEAVCANSYWGESWNGTNSLTGRPQKLPLPFYEPFSHNSAEGMSYTLIGADEIDKSPFRYCQFEAFIGKSISAMRFLAVCCIYPRQVEMLMKAGMREAVKDLVEGRKWNAAAFNWNEADPLESFQLSKTEMKDYLAGEKNLEALAYYKQFRRKKIKCEIAEVLKVMRQSPYEKTKSVIKRLKDHKIEPGRWNAYISKELELKGQKRLTARDAAQHWIDYIDAAVALGYDLTNPLMQMPKGIRKKHDAAVKAAAPVLAARRAAELGVKEKKRLEAAMERYGFSTEEYLIRAPVDSAEIADEGKALKHCVGGYAERHMNGKLTILFLRSTADPHTPLVTIEMNGSRMVQIHGYKNDVNKRIPPREKYAEILEPWQAWLAGGSKRDKDGNPILPQKKKIRQRVPAVAG